MRTKEGGKDSSSYYSSDQKFPLSQWDTEPFVANRSLVWARVISPLSSLAKIWVTLSFGIDGVGSTAGWSGQELG